MAKLAVTTSYHIPFKEQIKQQVPEGLPESFEEAKIMSPTCEWLMVDVERIIITDVKVKGVTVHKKYDLNTLKAIAKNKFDRTFTITTGKPEIVTYLRDPKRLEQLRENPYMQIYRKSAKTKPSKQITI